MAKRKLPPRPDCGSIEVNMMIRALNEGKTENPCPGSPERDRWWNNLVKNRKEVEEMQRRRGDKHPEIVIFEYMEPDYYEECLMEAAAPMPSGWLEEMLAEQKKAGEESRARQRAAREARENAQKHQGMDKNAAENSETGEGGGIPQ